MAFLTRKEYGELKGWSKQYISKLILNNRLVLDEAGRIQRDFTREEREQINAFGTTDGCHTCGATELGTKSGNFIPDHQTPNALNAEGNPQRLYPHCKACSYKQAGQVTQAKRRALLP